MESDFIQTVNAHAGIIQNVCRLYGKDEEDRKDLYQEIVLQLWRAFPSFRGEAKASTWMYRVALNTAISLFRRQSRQIAPVPLDQELLNLDQRVVSPDGDQQMQQFYHAIDQLSLIEKAIVFLYLDDNSYEEIARIAGISQSNVGVKLNRIKGKLKKIVELTNE
ncbi:RNA polymerase sigma factor [Spirosoma endbachense]|uniref:Sigma-70 family RNA polymerase sigma factor n=1 Tax=Spirosoma endbachense TaxID=2666025 RepID=A0A6P1VQ13_9BACT|nr:RNA polymerase sigma factor [Spirosoma endbachense]QHV94785.1 sigma-70 family RNA polymerase sigma factor [Spirosoma endbachense]